MTLSALIAASGAMALREYGTPKVSLHWDGGVYVTASVPGISLDRRIDLDGHVAYHQGFRVEPKLQRKGIATRVLSEQIQWYQRLGIRRIQLKSYDVGRYAWPSLGFAPVDFSDTRRRFEVWANGKGLAVTTPSDMQWLVRHKYGKRFLMSGAYPGEWLEMRV